LRRGRGRKRKEEGRTNLVLGRSRSKGRRQRNVKMKEGRMDGRVHKDGEEISKLGRCRKRREAIRDSGMEQKRKENQDKAAKWLLLFCGLNNLIKGYIPGYF
jgi:hypothetical protein